MQMHLITDYSFESCSIIYFLCVTPMTWTELSNSSFHIQQGDLGKDTIQMQVNCSDGYQAASEKVTFETRPTISRENASTYCLSVVPKLRGHFMRLEEQ